MGDLDVHRFGDSARTKHREEDFQELQRSQQMDGPTLGPLPPFFTIGAKEMLAVIRAMKKPLSGYLGGEPPRGYWINKLSNDWCRTFGCKYAIPCNSATGGLLAACMSLGVQPGDTIWTSAYTMSATAACGMVLGARPVFIDIETMRYSMTLNRHPTPLPKCIIVTNLFGHPAYLASMRSWCDSNNVWMIEDNAQAPFAKEGDKYAGTVGHIGVFSLNVHKHIQCGEGGVIVTNAPIISETLSGCINHGELRYPRSSGNFAGLNLRMTEPIAAIACTQLARAEKIIQSRIDLAEEMTDWFSGIPWLVPPVADKGCGHVYYIWAARVGGGRRNRLVKNLRGRGFPMRVGYSPPLNRILLSSTATHELPNVNRMEDEQLMTFEICSCDPTSNQRKLMREIAKRAVGEAA